MTRSPQPLLAIALLAVVLAAAPRPAWSAWPHDPFVNLPLCTAAGNQQYPSIASDGAGGAIVAWVDNRGSSMDIYAQRISAVGTVRWNTDGVALCTAAGDQSGPSIAPDGAGGAIVAWTDRRSGDWDVYAQRISASGTVQWATDGVVLRAGPGHQGSPIIASDGAGGAVVTWWDDGGGYEAFYAQRISASGTTQWTASGVAVCTAASTRWEPKIISDGTGGAIVTWKDYRSGSNYDIYAQRISAGGTVQWTANGVAVCVATGDQGWPTLASDGAGGAIVAWRDYRGSSPDIYAQRITGGGEAQWTANGVAVCTATFVQWWPSILSDGAAGAIIAWEDERAGGSYDIYAQRVSGTGAAQWTANGVAICTATGEQLRATIASDGAGGAIVAWLDLRGGGAIYAQRISGAGAARWTDNGSALCASASYQNSYGFPILADGAGGAIVPWLDSRNGSYIYDIYAQRVDEWGYLGAEPTIATVRDIPNDQGGKVKVSWSASPLDTDPLFRNVESYLVFRSAPPNQVAQALQRGATLTRNPGEAANQADCLLVTTVGALTYYWEYVGTQDAYHLPTYSMVAPTTGDSIPGSNPYTAFLVQAWATGGGNWWSSQPDSGYSVDNLTPAAPAPFTGEYASGTAILHWAVNSAPDLGEYRLYRGNTADFVPGAGNFVVAQPDTGYVDAAGSLCYYKLCAVDVHENVSGFSLLLPSGASDVPGPSLPRAVFLAPPAPNPAHGATAVRFGLPREAHVELALYDQRGRRVQFLLNGTLPAGEQTYIWDGCDESGHAMATGIYFVRLAAEGRTLVSRLAVIR